MDEARYTAIDRYLANEMDAAERQAFEEQLRQDPDLAEKITLYTQANQSLTGKYKSEDAEKAFRQTLAEATAENQTETGSKTTHLRWYTWAAAACITLLGVAIIYSIIDKPEYTDYAHFERLELTQRGNTKALQQDAQEAFNNGAYELAVVYFNTLLQQDPQNTELLLYNGIALLELNRIKEADSIFIQVSASPSVYQTKAQWLLALSALKQKEYSKCRTLLEAIPQDAEEYTVAQQLLNDL